MEYTDDDKEIVIDACRALLNRYTTPDWNNYHVYISWLDENEREVHTNTPEEIVNIFCQSLSNNNLLTGSGSTVLPSKDVLTQEVEGIVLNMAGGILFTKKHYVKIGEAVGRAIER